MASLESAKLVECPSQETLVGFNLGKLTAPEEESVGSHLADCPRCESVLQLLNEAAPGDTFVDNLKRCFSSEPLLDEPACADLQSFARGLLVELTDPGLHTAAFEVRTTREEPWVGRRIGNYHILAAIGHGGMGMVYRARQESVNRLVALKMVQAGLFAKPHTVRRFHTEGEAIARLRHPHVVQIYDFGQHDGLPYYSMELLEGGTLASRFAQGPIEPRAAASVVAQLASAIEFAHQNKVLHRDLKPGNVLLTADDTPKISDFGLAKLLDLEDGQTHGAEILGTPTYMSPEQAAGRPEKIGPAVDIYALGVILYEALTRRPPFRGPDKQETLRLILHAELVPPSKHSQGLHPDLEAICVKCLQREPGRRYASAGALAADLGRWLKGEPTEARPPRWPGRLWRAVKRHKVAAVLGVLLWTSLAAAYILDPQRPVREVTADLALGKAVTLLAETGYPPRMVWRSGREKSQISLSSDGSFSVHTWDAAFLELLQDPQHESYRLTAEVRHEKADPVGLAGIYALHQAYPGEGEDFQVCLKMEFNGKRRRTEFPADTPPEVRANTKPPSGKNQVLLGHYVLPGKPPPGKAPAPGGPLGGTARHLCVPSGDAPPAWHRLELVVTPQNIRGLWNGQLVGDLCSDTLIQDAGRRLAIYRARSPQDPFLAAIPPAIHRRGGLGLYLTLSSASFRNVTVVPLTDAD